jgi:hypothetical protein
MDTHVIRVDVFGESKHVFAVYCFHLHQYFFDT